MDVDDEKEKEYEVEQLILPLLRVAEEYLVVVVVVVVVALENDDDEREEIIFTGERTCIKTGIFIPFYGVSFQEDPKRAKESAERKGQIFT